MADYTILLIDYEPRSIDQLRRPLVDAGFRVEVAKDGISGAQRFAELEPDLTLIEAMLPKKHGFDLCKELKSTEHGRRSPVLIITAVYKGNKYRSQATRHFGCDAYLEKPIGTETLVQLVRDFLEPRQPTGGTEAAPDPATEEEEIAAHLDTVLPGEPSSAGDGAAAGRKERLDPPEGHERHRPAATIGTSPSFGTPAGSSEPHAGNAVLSTQGALAVANHPVSRPAAPVAAHSRLESASDRAAARPTRWGRILIWIAFAALVALGGTLAFLLR